MKKHIKDLISNLKLTTDKRTLDSGSKEKDLTLLSTILEKNIALFKEFFFYPNNTDFAVRKIFIKSLQKKAVLFYVEGLVNTQFINEFIIKPLVENDLDFSRDATLEELSEKSLYIAKTEVSKDYSLLEERLLSGSTVLLIDGYNKGISIDTIGYKHRNIGKPNNEMSVKGPQEAFVDSDTVNRSMIRRAIKDRNLITESITIGKEGKNRISVMYLKNITNPDLVQNVKGSLTNIKVDAVQNISILEQYIEKRPFSIVPTVLYTERPDRAVSFLLEGHVVLVDSSSACLVAPATFWSFFHVPEDYYQRWFYGNFIRLVRLMALFIALLSPAFYVALTNFHAEMIPTDLLIAFAATREVVPFPVFVEVVFMEISFELVREAGQRVPTVLGPTIGIVGALILGQAAVEANIVSPILVIIVAITGLSSFAIGETSLNYMIRISRFLFLFFGSILGFMGIAICLTLYTTYLLGIESFGVPFFSPLAPHMPSSNDTITRRVTIKQWLRPLYFLLKDKRRQ